MRQAEARTDGRCLQASGADIHLDQSPNRPHDRALVPFGFASNPLRPSRPAASKVVGHNGVERGFNATLLAPLIESDFPSRRD